MSQARRFIHFNGQALPADTPVFGAADRGALYGDGLFETLRAYDGVPFLLEEHLARLNVSARELRLGGGLDPRPVRDAIAELLGLNGLSDAYIRITLTRGPHTGALELDPPERPSLCIIARPLHGPQASRHARGVTAIIASVRQNAESPLPRHKTLNYLGNLLARTEARERGADEAILLTTRGEVAEAASSNLFLVAGGQLVTPWLEAGILPGITRAEILRLAADAGRSADERAVRPAELASANEVFLTNSIAELIPVRAINGQAIGAGAPGPVTRELHAAYRGSVQRYAEAALSATVH